MKTNQVLKLFAVQFSLFMLIAFNCEGQTKDYSPTPLTAAQLAQAEEEIDCHTNINNIYNNSSSSQIKTAYAAYPVKNLQYWKDQLKYANIEVDNAKAKYNDAQKFHLGRSSSQRNNDVNNASEYLEASRQYVKVCQVQINKF